MIVLFYTFPLFLSKLLSLCLFADMSCPSSSAQCTIHYVHYVQRIPRSKEKLQIDQATNKTNIKECFASGILINFGHPFLPILGPTSTKVAHQPTRFDPLHIEYCSAHWAKIGGHMDIEIVPFHQFLSYSNVIYIKMG